MDEDEQAIHNLVAEWQRAMAAHDLDTVMNLMADDVVFLVAGQEPFGKAVFAEASRAMTQIGIKGSSTIEELEIAGDWAWLRTRISVTMTPASGTAVHRDGYTLSIVRKLADGRWVLARDANLLAPPS